MNPLVSVIVPVYDVERYLPCCVESILNQTLTDFELILVDDGSPDRCGELCDAYARRDSRIRVIHQPNSGLSAARNAGLEVARGLLVGFIDSDDWVLPEYLERLIHTLDATGAGIIMCTFLRVWGDSLGQYAGSDDVEVLSATEAVRRIVEPRDGLTGGMEVATAKLYPRDLFDYVKYPVGRLHEDEYTTYKLILGVASVAVVSRPLYMYRQRNTSIMGTGPTAASRMDYLGAVVERRMVLRRHCYPYDRLRESRAMLAVYLWINHSFVEDRSGPRSGTDRTRFRDLGFQMLRMDHPFTIKARLAAAMAAPRVAAVWYGLRWGSSRRGRPLSRPTDGGPS